MKKVAIGLAAIVTVFIVAVVVAPSFIDWTRYRDGIAAEIERVLNRRVTITGDVAASIVPTPHLSLGGVRLGNIAGASSQTMAEAEALEVQVALWPLLTGRVVVTSVVLRNPVVTLEVLPDGRKNWVFAASAGAGSRVSLTDELPQHMQFDDAVVTNGTVLYRNAQTGTEERIDGINARFAAQGIHGPLRAAGELRLGDLPLRFSLATGRFDPRAATATPINLTAEVPGSRRGQAALGSLSFTGTARLRPGAPEIAGQLKLRGEDLAGLGTALAGGSLFPALLAQPFSLESAVEFKESSVSANDALLQLGGTRAQGAVIAAFTGDEPQLDIALSMGRIDLDAWSAVALKKRATGQASAPVEEEFVLPVGWRLTLDASAEAITYRGGAARQVKLAAEMSDGIVELHQLGMQLPGSATGLFTGKLLAVDGKPRLNGFAEINADDFRSLLSWLAIDASGLPAGRLNKLSASSHIGAGGELLDFGDIDVRFDNTKITGAIVAALRERPAFGINLIADRFDFAAYLPEGQSAGAAPGAAALLPLTALAKFDANLRLRVGELPLGAVAANGLTVDGTLQNGTLTLREMKIADLAGGRASLGGSIEGFDATLRSELHFDVETNEPAALLRAGGVALPLQDSALSPFSASGRLSGGGESYAVNTVINAGVASLTAVGEVGRAGDTPRAALDINFDHPDYVALISLADAAFAPQRPAPSRAVSLSTRLQRDGARYRLGDLDGRLGPLDIEGEIALAFDTGLPQVSARLAVDALDTRHFQAAQKKPGDSPRWSSQPIELMLARVASGTLDVRAGTLRHDRWTVSEAKAELAFGKGAVELKQLAGGLLGGELELHGRLVPGDGPDESATLDYALKLTGAEPKPFLFDGANIDIGGGRLDLALEGQSKGGSEAVLVAGLAGKGSVVATNVQLKGFDLPRLNQRYGTVQSPGELARLIQSAMSSGATPVQELRGDITISGGVISSDNLVVRTAVGSARALVAADLPQWRLDAAAEVRLANTPNGPSFDMQLTGPIDAPKREFDSEALQAFMLEESARRNPPPSRTTPQSAPQSAPKNTPQTSTPEATRQGAPQNATPRRQPAAPPAPASSVPRSAPAPATERPAALQEIVPQDSAVPASPVVPPATRPEAETPSQPAPRVLSVSPNAPGGAPSTSGSRVLNVSPNADPATARPPASDGQSSGAPNAPRVISRSPNAAAPVESTPAEPPSAPDSARPAPSGAPDVDSFTRDILRELSP